VKILKEYQDSLSTTRLVSTLKALLDQKVEVNINFYDRSPCSVQQTDLRNRDWPREIVKEFTESYDIVTYKLLVGDYGISIAK